MEMFGLSELGKNLQETAQILVLLFCSFLVANGTQVLK